MQRIFKTRVHHKLSTKIHCSTLIVYVILMNRAYNLGSHLGLNDPKQTVQLRTVSNIKNFIEYKLN